MMEWPNQQNYSLKKKKFNKTTYYIFTINF